MAQVLPADDDFTESPPAGGSTYGKYLIGYLGWEPYTVATYGWDAGLLLNSTEYDTQYGRSAYGYRVGDFSEGEKGQHLSVGFVRREQYTENQRVSATFSMHPGVGSYPKPLPIGIDWLGLHYWGEFSVGARIQGGKLVDDGLRTVRLTNDINYGGYVFTLSMEDGGGWTSGPEVDAWRFSLRRLMPGTPASAVELAGVTYSGAALTAAGVSLAYPFTLSLKAVTVPGVSVVLTAFVSGLYVDAWGTFASFDPFGGSVTDSSADRTIGGGRAGFTLPGQKLYGAVYGGTTTLISGIHTFEVYDVDADAVVIRDQMERAAKWTGYPITTTVAWTGGKVGYSVQSDFAFDQGSYTYAPGETAVLPRLVRDVGSNRVEFLGPGTSAEEFVVAQSVRRSTDEFASHRDALFIFHASGSNGTDPIRWCGIVLRGRYSQSPAGSVGGWGTSDLKSLTGYGVVVAMEGADFKCYIYRFANEVVGSKAGTLLITSATSLNLVITEGAAFTLGFEVYVTDDVPDVNASVSMSVTVDGVAILFAPATAIGIVVDATETVLTDSTSSMIPPFSARSEMILLRGTNTTKDITFDTWDEDTLHGPPPSTAADTQATISVETETGSPSATINDALLPDFPFDTQTEWFSQQDRFDSGHMRTKRAFSKARRRYSFKASARPKSERDALLTFYNARSGAQDSFYFTPTGDQSDFDGTQVTVHFVEDSLKTQKVWAETYSVSFTLEELL